MDDLNASNYRSGSANDFNYRTLTLRLGRIKLSKPQGIESNQPFHPATLDAVMESAKALTIAPAGITIQPVGTRTLKAVQ